MGTTKARREGQTEEAGNHPDPLALNFSITGEHN